MPTLEVSVNIKQDGVPLQNFPLIRRLLVTEAEMLNYAQATGASFVTVPGTPLSTGMVIALLMLTADQPIAIHTNNQNAGDAGIILNAGGMMIIIDGNFSATPLAQVQNNSGQTANIRGLAAGT